MEPMPTIAYEDDVCWCEECGACFWKDDTAEKHLLYLSSIDKVACYSCIRNREPLKEAYFEEIVIRALEYTDYMRNVESSVIEEHPEIVMILHMATCPPIARDRLMGLAHATKGVMKQIDRIDNPRIPPNIAKRDRPRLERELGGICHVIQEMADRDLMAWLKTDRKPTKKELERSSTVIADRLCGTLSDPIIRNAQEERQMKKINDFLNDKGYRLLTDCTDYRNMDAGSYAIHMEIPAYTDASKVRTVKVSVDVAVLPKDAKQGDLPILIEAKSAGDFTNVNKRRKEEADKIAELKWTYDKVSYNLFLCGYFNSAYLGYEAAKGIDWIWEHRMEDLNLLGL